MNATVAHVAASVGRVQDAAPLVQCITNYVSMDIMANVLLALGCSPAMVHCEEEAGDFARIASALSVNLGTLSPAWVAGMKKAVEQTRAMNKPWVLDPVGMGATPYRSRCTAERARMKPTVIRGNASEIKSLYAALGGHSAVAGKGVDSAHSTDAALHDAVALARHLECVVACTGHVDYITDGARVVATRNGHPLMTKVTAVGCSLSSVVAAFVAACPADPLMATAHAICAFNAAGDAAARGEPGPGTFRVRFMDELHGMLSKGRGQGLAEFYGDRAAQVIGMVEWSGL